MTKRPVPKPTDAELTILRVLWAKGPSSVRQVHDILSADRALAYTTTLKLLQIMNDKGLVVRKEEGRQHVYSARDPQETTQRRLVRDLLDRAFDGSPANLLMQALASKRASPEDLEQIRRLIEEQEKNDD